MPVTITHFYFTQVIKFSLKFGLFVINNHTGPPVIVLITSLGSPASIFVYDPFTFAQHFSNKDTHISLSLFFVNAILPFFTGILSSNGITFHSPFIQNLTPYTPNLFALSIGNKSFI